MIVIMNPLNKLLTIILFVYNALAHGWKVKRLEDGSFLFKKSLKDISQDEDIHSDDFTENFIEKNLASDTSSFTLTN